MKYNTKYPHKVSPQSIPTKYPHNYNQRGVHGVKGRLRPHLGVLTKLTPRRLCHRRANTVALTITFKQVED